MDGLRFSVYSDFPAFFIRNRQDHVAVSILIVKADGHLIVPPVQVGGRRFWAAAFFSN